jgi:hypothetical protein
MALFLGGPADGWRIEIDTHLEKVTIPINPHPPGYTPDIAVLTGVAGPAYEYKREEIQCSLETYYVYVPLDWNCSDIVEALILGYKPEKDYQRLQYVRTAEGLIYDNDDSIRDGNTYPV